MSKLLNRKFTNWDAVTVLFIVELAVIFDINGAGATDLCSGKAVIELDAQAGHISSRDVKLKSDKADCQMWRIQTIANTTITISFSKLFDEVYFFRDHCDGVTQIILGPEPETTICTSKGSYVYHSKRDHVWIKFYRYPDGLFQPLFELDYITSDGAQCEDRCLNGQCIFTKWVCNSVNECEDSSDETGCYNLEHESGVTKPPTTVRSLVTCGYGEIFCYVIAWQRYMCLHNLRKCDGTVDCQSGEDENHALCGDEICNRVLEEPVGWFASPNFPDLYPNNLKCSWVIHQLGTSSSFTIQLRMMAFKLEPEVGTDVLRIYDGPDYTYRLIGTYYGEQWPPQIIESTSNWMNIVFETNAYRQYYGFNFTYQIKGECLSTQQKCEDEKDCYSPGKRCDGVWDCVLHGSDERGCNCAEGEYSCGQGTNQCYHLQERCNGISRCSNSADENNCTHLQCGSHNGTFLCGNKRCIYESWTCDGRDDCGDRSDEVSCSGSTKRVIIATISGAMVCALMMVILLGCSCKLYSLRTAERHGGPRHETPMTRLYAEFLRRRAPPPYHEAMLTSRNFDEVQQEILERMRHATRRSRRNRRRSSRNNQSGGGVTEGAIPVAAPVCGGGESQVDTGTASAQAQQLSSILEETGNAAEREAAETEPAASCSDTESADTESNHSDQDQGQAEGRSDPDVDNILESESLSALWERDVPGDNESSDDACILEDNVSILNETSPGQCDTASLETASTSIDFIEMPEIQTSSTFPKDSDVENESDNSVEDVENSRNSTPKPESFNGSRLISGGQSSHICRSQSQDSLNSTGSENLSDSELQMVSFNMTQVSGSSSDIV